MRVYLVRYDRVGNCQYVAIATSEAQLERYLEAGFVEVEFEEYQRCERIAESVSIIDLGRIVAGFELLRNILAGGGGSQQAPVNPDRDALEGLINNFQRTSRNRMQDYLKGDISLEEWYTLQSRHIVRSRLAARAAGVGGVQNLTQNDIRQAEIAARRELTYLAQFRDELAAGSVSERQALARVGMYAGGNREQFERAHSDALGLPRLPAYPGVRTDCRKNCKCSWRIVRLGNGDFDCFWQRSPVDSCDTCKTRERAFNPLQVRGGAIQPFATVGIYSQQ